MKAAGFECARDLVEFICRDFDEIYENGRDLLLYKYGKKDALAYVELTLFLESILYKRHFVAVMLLPVLVAVI